MIDLIDEACQAGARLHKACEVAGLSERTLQRWQAEAELREDGRKAAAQQRKPANALPEAVRQQILETANQPRFADKTPHQIVPMLADEGTYLASESSIYRILREAEQLAHRGKAKAPERKRPAPLQADAPNQVWSWDITYLMTPVAGRYFYLYLIMDIYSRKIVGWEVYECESSAYASEVFKKAHLREGVGTAKLALHSDNGSPMKGATLLATLQKLGVVASFSRPSVSNDNPYSESLFKTLKYQPTFPQQPFDNLPQARQWVQGFVHWYNEQHLHSEIRFVTPSQRHAGLDSEILAKRHRVYEAAKAEHPERWSGKTRNWQPVGCVSLNPNKQAREESA
jgi:transposase InsO family protein